MKVLASLLFTLPTLALAAPTVWDRPTLTFETPASVSSESPSAVCRLVRRPVHIGAASDTVLCVQREALSHPEIFAAGLPVVPCALATQPAVETIDWRATESPACLLDNSAEDPGDGGTVLKPQFQLRYSAEDGRVYLSNALEQKAEGPSVGGYDGTGGG